MNDIVRQEKSVSVRRVMAGNSRVMQSLSTVDRALFQATTEMTIEEYDERVYIQAMTEALRWIAKDVGIRETDGPEWSINSVRICRTLARYYGFLTIKEIRLAFEMCVAGELDEYFYHDRFGNPNKEHYQNFNIEYVCRVIQAYNKRRAVVIEKANKEIERPEDPKIVAEMTRNYFNGKLVQCVLMYKYHGVMPELGPVSVIMMQDVLQRIGMIDVNEECNVRKIREAVEYIVDNELQIKELIWKK